MAKGRKTGGRTKGTPNRLTFQVRMLLLNGLEEEIEKIPVLMDELRPKDRIDCLCKLLPYILPKIHKTTVKHADQLGLKPSSDEIESINQENEKDRLIEKMILFPKI